MNSATKVAPVHLTVDHRALGGVGSPSGCIPGTANAAIHAAACASWASHSLWELRTLALGATPWDAGRVPGQPARWEGIWCQPSWPARNFYCPPSGRQSHGLRTLAVSECDRLVQHTSQAAWDPYRQATGVQLQAEDATRVHPERGQVHVQVAVHFSWGAFS